MDINVLTFIGNFLYKKTFFHLNHVVVYYYVVIGMHGSEMVTFQIILFAIEPSILLMTQTIVPILHYHVCQWTIGAIATG